MNEAQMDNTIGGTRAAAAVKWKDDALQEAKNLLERIKAGDDGVIQEASDLLDMR